MGAFEKMLVVGSGQYAGYPLYWITSDQPPTFGWTTQTIPNLPGGLGDAATGSGKGLKASGGTFSLVTPRASSPGGPAPGHRRETGAMRPVLNILWLVFGGLVMAMGYALAGIVMCILIITIPFGVAAFRLAGYTLWPFGRTVVAKPGAGVGSFVLNVVWFVLAGLWLAIGHLLSGLVLCLTIIGIPLGLAHFKLIPVCVAPLGKEIVPSGEPIPMAAV